MYSDDAGRPSYSVDRVLMVRYIAGEASPRETAAVERWLAASPARGAELAELRRIWARAGALPPEGRIDALWRELHQRMHQPAVSPAVRALPVALPQRRHRPARRWMLAGLAAASLAAAVGAAVRSQHTMPAAVGAARERVYSTARGQRAVVGLPDGTRVQLGVDSRIRVSLGERGRREVRLEGEAVFDVMHDARRPFVVYAGHAIMEDLGTTFGVRAYADDPAVRVVVVSGKVALRPAGRTATAPGAARDVVLGPRDVGELDTAGDARVQGGIDPETYLSWTRGRLVFREAPLREITAQLERWYDVTITVPDSAARRRLTLTLDTPSLPEALDALVVPLGWHYERRGNTVVLHS